MSGGSAEEKRARKFTKGSRFQKGAPEPYVRKTREGPMVEYPEPVQGRRHCVNSHSGSGKHRLARFAYAGDAYCTDCAREIVREILRREKQLFPDVK